MTVIVQLAGPAQETITAAASLGIQLTPLHPGIRDPALATWYVAASSSDDEAAAASLRGLDGVAAAYVRPDAEPA